MKQVIWLSLLLTGCALGPDFLHPEPPTATGYTAQTLPEQTESANGMHGEAQRFTSGEKIPAEWWTVFGNQNLNAAITQALKDSPTIAAAEARLRQAQENANAQSGVSLFPQIDLKAGAQREKFSTAAIGLSDAGPNSPIPNGNVFNLYNASVNVSYALDIFGGARRQNEALEAESEYQAFELKGAHLTLAANITTAALKDAALKAQIEATSNIIHDEEERANVTEKQLALGGTSQKQVASLNADIEQTKATLPPLEKEREQLHHQLAVYLGKTPSEATIPEFALDSFTLPQALPVNLPSELVRHRPDIRAAEARFHRASAEVGVATANLFPKLTLSADYGPQTTSASDFFKADSMIWSLGASLTQPIFHGGELLAKKRSAVAAYDEAAANYRQTVLQAFQQVADSLKALEADAKTLKASAEAQAQAKHAYDITAQQYRLGGASYLEMLNAKRAYTQTTIALAQAQATRLSDTAALFHALGGGWNDDSQGKNKDEK